MAKQGSLSINSENIFPIIKKWLYSDHDIFIRELVSNGCDAVTKLKKLSVMGEFEEADDEKYKVEVRINPTDKTLTFIDNGIGMTEDEVDEYINQIAFSGAAAFMEQYKDKASDEQIIGHFGLGFYSAFMVADKVTIDTLSYKEDATPVHWECDGGTEFDMEDGDKAERGTTITLYLNDESYEFCNEYRCREVLNKYCSFMPVEIYFVNEEEEAKKAEEAAKKDAEEKVIDVDVKDADAKENNADTEDGDSEVTLEEEEEEEEIVSYKFGFSCISMENPYYETLEASIREAIEESGSTLISRDPKGDSTAQIQQIRDMIADGIQAIFLCPVDWEKIAPALTELKEADIEIINLDTQVQDREEVDAYVGSDNINAGVICGEKLIEAAPDGGQVVILECTTQNSIIDRINGFEETIAGKGFEVVERSETGGKKDEAKTQMARILKEQDHITAVMCGNDQIALGALEAIEEAGRSEMMIYSVDGSPKLKQELAKDGSLVVGIAAQSPINIGKSAVTVALQIMNGERYEKETLEEVLFIDRSNVGMYGVDGWQ